MTVENCKITVITSAAILETDIHAAVAKLRSCLKLFWLYLSPASAQVSGLAVFL